MTLRFLLALGAVALLGACTYKSETVRQPAAATTVTTAPAAAAVTTSTPTTATTVYTR